MQKNSGFTLIEIAIVLVIIGLLLGGVLKGQELINNAKVRNIISQQDSYKAAFFAFQDRFRALPGDYAQAGANIPGISTATQQGDGNSQIEDTGCAESVVAWAHLTRAGFISGNFAGTCTGTPASTENSPTNAYGGVVQIIFDASFAGSTTSAHNVKTGNLVPANIIGEIDRKIDDGFPTSGIFRFSAWSVGTGTAPTVGDCVSSDTTPAWKSTSGTTNCGGAYLF